MNNFKVSLGIMLVTCLAAANAVKPAYAHTIAQVRTTIQTHVPQVHNLNVHTTHINLAPSVFQRVSTLNLGAASALLQHTYLVNSNRALTVSATSKPTRVSVTTVPTTDAQANQDITDVLNNDWSSWTGSATKPLTFAEVAKLLKSPTITGSQAAVLSMIADQMYNDVGEGFSSKPSYTLSQATAYLSGTANSQNALWFGTDPITGRSLSGEQFSLSMSQIASSTNANGTLNLYGSYTAPYLNTSGPAASGASIQQGYVGDCFFMSAVNGVLTENPQLISSMITEGKNGSFTVAFPHGPKETFTLTDGEIGLFSNAINGGCWLAAMGMAENSAIKSESGVPAILKTAPLGLVTDGGDPAQTLSLLTGSSYSDTQANSLSSYTVASVNSLLAQDFANHTPIGVSSSDHALAIIGFNAQTQTVTILNPWGISSQYGYQQDSGVMNPNMEVNMHNGVFTLTTQQMLSDFQDLTVPTSLSNVLVQSGGGGFSGFAGRSDLRGSLTFNSINSAMTAAASLAQQPATSLSLPQASLSPGNVSLDKNAAGNAVLTTAGAVGQVAGSAQVQVKETTTLDTIAAASSGRTVKSAGTATYEQAVYEAGQGSMLVVHDSPVEVHTGRGTVHVNAHAAALIVQVGNEVAVSNLCDKRSGDIAVTVGDQNITLPMGRTIILSDTNVADSQKTQLIECVDGKQAARLEQYTDASVFMGRASYTWAIKNCPQFHELMHSTDSGERKAAMTVLKAGAAVMTLAQAPQD